MITDSYFKFDSSSTEYNLVSCRLVTRCENNGFHPTTAPKVDYMELVVNSESYFNILYGWFFNNLVKSGQVYFNIPNSSGTDMTRTITFSDAYCFSIVDDYSKDINRQRQITLKVTMGSFTVDSLTFEK